MLFDEGTEMYRIEVLAYSDDTLIEALDLASGDTLRLPAQLYVQDLDSTSVRALKYPWTNHFPEIHEQVVVMRLGRNICLYARHEGEYYHFWCPDGMHHFITFVMAKDGVFKPSVSCENNEHPLNPKAYMCPEFLAPKKMVEEYLPQF